MSHCHTGCFAWVLRHLGFGGSCGGACCLRALGGSFTRSVASAFTALYGSGSAGGALWRVFGGLSSAGGARSSASAESCLEVARRRCSATYDDSGMCPACSVRPAIDARRVVKAASFLVSKVFLHVELQEELVQDPGLVRCTASLLGLRSARTLFLLCTTACTSINTTRERDF